MLHLFAMLMLTADPPPPLTLDVIRDVVHEHRAQIRKCYDVSPSGKKKASAKVVVRFVIGDDGSVGEAAVKEVTVDDEALETCIVGAVKTWKFPKPKHGPAAINFPFQFG
ncbi:MAG: energy transducer TonB, partial [Myxococcaceae bacterium]|nr:energy transducer TonB [Myxococcaceae bacterium]